MEDSVRLNPQTDGATEGKVVSALVLVCAVLGSLATGVLLAYGICMAMFMLFRMHVRTLAAGKPAVKPKQQIARG